MCSSATRGGRTGAAVNPGRVSRAGRRAQEEGSMAKILLVEDNEYNRDMLSRRLQRNAYQVVCAVDGAEATRLAVAERPDVILMDMHLPVMDGWETTRYLKGSAETAAIPIIALTADAMSGDREKALQ